MSIRSVFGLVFLGALAACYGTTAPPPLSSPTPPPGLSTLVSGAIRTPVNLPDLIKVYRQSLVEQAHNLPPPKAEQYADTEIVLLKRRYDGRDEDLKAELTRRLQATQSATPRPAPQPGQVRAGLLPRDPADQQNGGGR